MWHINLSLEHTIFIWRKQTVQLSKIPFTKKDNLTLSPKWICIFNYFYYYSQNHLIFIKIYVFNLFYDIVINTNLFLLNCYCYEQICFFPSTLPFASSQIQKADSMKVRKKLEIQMKTRVKLARLNRHRLVDTSSWQIAS